MLPGKPSYSARIDAEIREHIDRMLKENGRVTAASVVEAVMKNHPAPQSSDADFLEFFEAASRETLSHDVARIMRSYEPVYECDAATTSEAAEAIAKATKAHADALRAHARAQLGDGE